MKTVRVNRKAADRIAAGHPWIFESDLADRGEAVGGDAVLAADPRGRILGTFHYSDSSRISLRQLSDHPVTTDREFFRGRIARALEHRRRVVSGSDAFRLVYGEADGLPALVIDVYGDAVALQTLNQGMDRSLPDILAVVEELLTPELVVARNDAAVRKLENLPAEIRVLSGEAGGPATIRMNGLEWGVDLLKGQKTGIYLDQRENYLAAARWARGAALDCFTSTGGFALHLAAVCPTVEAVDSSAEAIGTASGNARRNGIENIKWRESDAFDLLAGFAQGGKKFGTVVLDPPAFAKSRAAIDGALRGYRDINYRALRILEPGGILISCSCSHHFSEAMLLETVAAAALDARRTLRVLERRIQASDHPVLLTVPETLYLKCLIFQAV